MCLHFLSTNIIKYVIEYVFVSPCRGARGAAQPGGAAGEGQVWGRRGSVQGNSQQELPLPHMMCAMETAAMCQA